MQSHITDGFRSRTRQGLRSSELSSSVSSSFLYDVFRVISDSCLASARPMARSMCWLRNAKQQHMTQTCPFPAVLISPGRCLGFVNLCRSSIVKQREQMSLFLRSIAISWWCVKIHSSQDKMFETHVSFVVISHREVRMGGRYHIIVFAIQL